MLLSIFLISLLTLGGTALTYLFAEDEPLIWRLAAGNIAGQAVFALICFIAACFFGLTPAVILIAILVTLAPLIVFERERGARRRLKSDWASAKQKLFDADRGVALRFAYYATFFVLFCFFFDRAMFEVNGAIYTGASNNLGDLPFHLGAIFSFTDGQNFPPQNPSFAGAKFTYPFMADLIAACFVKSGATVIDAMFVQNVALALSLLVIFERFVFKLTGSRSAGKIAPVLLFFSGGLGFLWFFKDALEHQNGIWDFLWNLPRDYTIGKQFRWGNSLTTLFVTQRSLLLGMPLTIFILQKIWETFRNGKTESQNGSELSKALKETNSGIADFPLSHFIAGLLAGTLLLVHAHSLFVLFVVCAVLLVFSINKWREWLTFAMGVGIIAVPELLWAFTGSATRTNEFIDWFFGWDKQETNFFWFWLKNTGIFLPITALGAYLYWFKQTGSRAWNDQESPAETRRDSTTGAPLRVLLLFYVPFALLFIISNVAKLAPWEWDNIKVLIYWFAGSIPFAAFALAWMWNKNVFLKFISAGCLAVLILAGALDVWRQTSRAVNYEDFPSDAVKVSEIIKAKTPANALFLNAPTYNSPVVLTGRRSLMRYTGHLASHGIDFSEREADLRRIYSGDGTAELTLRKYGIDYVLIGPKVREYMQENNIILNEGFFSKYPVIAEAGEYKVYQVK